MESMIWYEHSERTEYDQRRVATRLFYNVCPEPYATRVDALFSVQLSPSQTFTISLFLRLITTRICSQTVARTNKYLELA